jgi:hypothetical protein
MSLLVFNHDPLHLSMRANHQPKRRFKFKLFWLKLEGFDEADIEEWNCDASIVDPLLRLDACDACKMYS